ncbi:hypothetical protein HDV00_007252 [Rhizophlyctis rosea]|nr:hypothetical protein HDV00_007252 [Rhizophlyctis rosea]
MLFTLLPHRTVPNAQFTVGTVLLNSDANLLREDDLSPFHKPIPIFSNATLSACLADWSELVNFIGVEQPATLPSLSESRQLLLRRMQTNIWLPTSPYLPNNTPRIATIHSLNTLRTLYYEVRSGPTNIPTAVRGAPSVVDGSMGVGYSAMTCSRGWDKTIPVNLNKSWLPTTIAQIPLRSHDILPIVGAAIEVLAKTRRQLQMRKLDAQLQFWYPAGVLEVDTLYALLGDPSSPQSVDTAFYGQAAVKCAAGKYVYNAYPSGTPQELHDQSGVLKGEGWMNKVQQAQWLVGFIAPNISNNNINAHSASLFERPTNRPSKHHIHTLLGHLAATSSASFSLKSTDILGITEDVDPFLSHPPTANTLPQPSASLLQKLQWDWRDRTYLARVLGGGNEAKNLQFLGDSVVELVAARFLFRKAKATGSWGSLTQDVMRAVDNETLGRLADDQNIAVEFGITGLSSKAVKKRGNFMESIIGAAFLDDQQQLSLRFCTWVAARLGLM